MASSPKHTLIFATDIGCADPDDVGAALFLQGYANMPRSKFTDIVYLCVGGNNTLRNANILAKCLESTDRDDVRPLEEMYLVVAEPTKGGHDLEYGKDWVGPCHTMKTLERRITGDISVLVGGPLAGVAFDDFIDWTNSVLHSCVFVGNKPSPGSLGVNGGGTLTSPIDKAEIMANLAVLESRAVAAGGAVVYLPREFTRAQPMTLKNLQMYNNELLTKLYVDVTTKYLLKERPTHLMPGLQLRIANANLCSLRAICEAWPKGTIRPADSINDPAFVKAGLLYSQRTDFGPEADQSMMDIDGVDDVDKGKMRAKLAEATAQIFTCQAFINTLCFTADPAPTPEEGFARYVAKLPQGADMPLMPYYDGIGAAVICLMSRDQTRGLVYKSFLNAFSINNKCPESERYPMEVMQHMLHFELSKF